MLIQAIYKVLFLTLTGTFIPNRIIKCNYRHPPWMTDDMETKLKERSKLTKKYYKNDNMKSDINKVIVKSNECTEAISAAKDKYIKQSSQSAPSWMLQQP